MGPVPALTGRAVAAARATPPPTPPSWSPRKHTAGRRGEGGRRRAGTRGFRAGAKPRLPGRCVYAVRRPADPALLSSYCAPIPGGCAARPELSATHRARKAKAAFNAYRARATGNAANFPKERLAQGGAGSWRATTCSLLRLACNLNKWIPGLRELAPRLLLLLGQPHFGGLPSSHLSHSLPFNSFSNLLFVLPGRL